MVQSPEEVVGDGHHGPSGPGVAEDDGAGGADPAGGSGLRGLADRVEALGGSLVVQSPAEHGTEVRAVLPLTAPR